MKINHQISVLILLSIFTLSSYASDDNKKLERLDLAQEENISDLKSNIA
mgnify:CR=1 FL=1